MEKKKDNYKTIRLPIPIIEQIDETIQEHPIYVSRSEFVKEAIRKQLEKIKAKK